MVLVDDAGLVARAARADASALRGLFERHAGRALAVALRILRSRAEAEEVVQETFLEIWRRAREYDAARGGVTGWILTICRTRAIDRVRARASATRVAGAAAAEPEAPAAASPLEEIEQRQERERVQAALTTLPVEQRKVIELAYFEGLSQTQIAERTGDALGTVKTRVRLAIDKLAALLRPGVTS